MHGLRERHAREAGWRGAPKDVPDNARDETTIWAVNVRSLHGVRLAAGRLTVGEDGAVVALEDVLDNGLGGVVVHILLLGLLAEDAVERERGLAAVAVNGHGLAFAVAVRNAYAAPKQLVLQLRPHAHDDANMSSAARHDSGWGARPRGVARGRFRLLLCRSVDHARGRGGAEGLQLVTEARRETSAKCKAGPATAGPFRREWQGRPRRTDRQRPAVQQLLFTLVATTVVVRMAANVPRMRECSCAWVCARARWRDAIRFSTAVGSSFVPLQSTGRQTQAVVSRNGGWTAWPQL